MGFIAEIAKLARLGDVEGLNKLLDERAENADQIILGRAAADRALKRDTPLPQLSRDPILDIDGWHDGRAGTGERIAA